ncbi:MAG: response regulator [Mycobacterium sp.]|nr:response regulator [Mycobacterium sp.]
MLLILGLVAENYTVTARQRSYSEASARTETTTNNVFYSLSESLSYINESQRYLLGKASRRDVQLKRALLAQRMAVVDQDGMTVAESGSPEFRATLGALDEAIAQVPPGILPADQRERWAAIILPRSEALWRASRRLADSTIAVPHSEARTSSGELLRSRFLQSALLVASLMVATVLLGWVAANFRRQYRSARAALDRQRKTLQSTEDQLDRVSFLDRGQAEVLELIATGQPMPTVMRRIAALTLAVTGRQAVRMTTDSLSLTLPTTADLSAEPVWSRTFQTSGTAGAGTLEVFGEPDMFDELDDLAREALLRCLDLASLELEREEARNAANALAEAKSQYVATVSHEFRAPLHAILGFSELLENQLTAKQTNEAEEWAGRIRREAERLARLIGDLLNLSRLDAGETHVVARPFQLRKMVDDLIQTCRVTAAGKGIRLNSWVDPAISDWRSGDPDRLHQVLLNLISNATKFTRVGRIDVEIASAATGKATDLVRFAVTDTGPGIPADEIDRILEPFAQVSSSDAERGSGLGLAISNRIVQVLGGGGLAIISAEGRGSTFHFTLPLPEATPLEEKSRPVVATAGGVATGTILVVDDSEANQLLAKAQLKKLGYRYETASDGAEALERLRSGHFDLVLMDCNMPVMDGYEATRRLRLKERGRGVHVPVLALTASTEGGNRDACERAGMDGFLTKPLLLTDLARELRRFLGAGAADRSQTTETPRTDPPRTADSPILDDAWVERLITEIGTAALRKVVGAFIAETPRRLDELRKASEDSDAEALRRSAHAIRSPSAMLGAVALADRVREIEESANPVATARAQQLGDVVNVTVERLQAKLAQMDPSAAAR